MTIKRYDKPHKEQIDLNGPQGNAFCLLGVAKRYASTLGYDWDEIEGKMTDGDYENLVQIFDDYFGEFVDIYR